MCKNDKNQYKTLVNIPRLIKIVKWSIINVGRNLVAFCKLGSKGDEEMKPTIFDVAAYVIDKCGEMTTMKLEKLVYYCQAWSLAWDGEPLFDDEFEAWANGPVSPTLFAKHKGKFRVGKETFKNVDLTKFNEDQLATMDAVIRDLGDKTSHWLSDLTHSEIPWQEARNGCCPGERCSNIIDKDSMQQYYGSL